MYDFTTVIDRTGQHAFAIDGPGRIPGVFPESPDEGFDVIPLWVADMSFATCPSITKALKKRVEHPLFGYFITPQEFYERVVYWQTTRHQVKGLTKQAIGYENGVVAGVITAAQVLCTPGETLLIHSPHYNGFENGLCNAGFRLERSPLVRDDCGIMRMDFEDMERRIVAKNIHALVFCNPHNPCGRVWDAEELARMMALCQKHDVYVISDEIWSDLIAPGYRHLPLQSVSADARGRVIALYALGKTFNLSGMLASYHIIYNERLKHLMERQGKLNYYNEMHVLSLPAFLGAYTPEGAQWVNELMQVISGNMELAISRLSRYPGVRCTKPQATYMLFVDFSAWCADHGMTVSELAAKGCRVGVTWQDGRIYHDPDCIRMNLALPRALLEKALERIDRYVLCAG